MPSYIVPIQELLGACLLAFAQRTGYLRQAMNQLAYRRLLGPDRLRAAWRSLGAEIDDTAIVGHRVSIRDAKKVSIGAGSALNGFIWIDSWNEVTIGRNVQLNGQISLLTGGHDIDSPQFKGKGGPITIGDYAWLPMHIIVLPGVTIGSHAVIGTGSVVTQSVPEYAVVAGNPARVVGERARQDYEYVPSVMLQRAHPPRRGR